MNWKWMNVTEGSDWHFMRGADDIGLFIIGLPISPGNDIRPGAWYNKESVIVLNDQEFMIEKMHHNWSTPSNPSVSGPFLIHFKRLG